MLPPRLFPLFLILAATPLAAQSGLYADFDVGEDIGQGFGTLSFTVELDIPTLIDTSAAPRLVANFIRLAEGNTPWLDEATAQIKKEPFFDGLRFYQLFGDIQTHFGSRDNTGFDGAGYILQDDFRSGPTTLDGLYMNNDGYNSNGSRFFISVPNSPSLQGNYCRIGNVLNVSPQAYYPQKSGFLNVSAISYGDTDGSGFAEHPSPPPTTSKPGPPPPASSTPPSRILSARTSPTTSSTSPVPSTAVPASSTPSSPLPKFPSPVRSCKSSTPTTTSARSIISSTPSIPKSPTPPSVEPISAEANPARSCSMQQSSPGPTCRPLPSAIKTMSSPASTSTFTAISTTPWTSKAAQTPSPSPAASPAANSRPSPNPSSATSSSTSSVANGESSPDSAGLIHMT